MNLETGELVRIAKKPFEMNAEYFDEGDEVLIITDTEISDSVLSALFAGAASIGLDPTMAIMTPRKADNTDPTKAMAGAIESADFYVLAASKALAHSNPSVTALESGSRTIVMQGLTPAILRSEAANTDYKAMLKVAEKLGKLYDKGSEVKVTSPQGTNITANIEDRYYWTNAGIMSEERNLVTFPDGEAGVAPREGTTEGTVVWDMTLHGIGSLTEPIELTVKDGWVTEIKGGEEADQFRQLLEEEGDDNTRNAAEIAVGINSGAEFTGSLRTDKKVEGSVHFAIGDNSNMDGEIESKLHLDGVIAEPNVWIDDKQIVDEGNLLVEP